MVFRPSIAQWKTSSPRNHPKIYVGTDIQCHKKLLLYHELWSDTLRPLQQRYTDAGIVLDSTKRKNGKLALQEDTYWRWFMSSVIFSLKVRGRSVSLLAPDPSRSPGSKAGQFDSGFACSPRYAFTAGPLMRACCRADSEHTYRVALLLPVWMSFLQRTLNWPLSFHDADAWDSPGSKGRVRQFLPA